MSSSELVDSAIRSSLGCSHLEFLEGDRGFLTLALDDTEWVNQSLGKGFEVAREKGDFELCSRLISGLYQGFSTSEERSRSGRITTIEGGRLCPFCGCKRLRAREIQNRSADEGSSTHYKCVECGGVF